METNSIGPAHGFGGGRGWVRLDPRGFLLLEWARAGTVTAADASAALEAVQQLTDGAALPILIRINGNDVDPAAAVLLRQTTLVSAVALVGATPVDRVVGAKMRRGRRQPHAFFVDEDSAAQWLLPFTSAGTTGTQMQVPPAASSGWLRGGRVAEIAGSMEQHGHPGRSLLVGKTSVGEVRGTALLPCR